jgi:hypothetical protein
VLPPPAQSRYWPSQRQSSVMHVLSLHASCPAAQPITRFSEPPVESTGAADSGAAHTTAAGAMIGTKTDDLGQSDGDGGWSAPMTRSPMLEPLK